MRALRRRLEHPTKAIGDGRRHRGPRLRTPGVPVQRTPSDASASKACPSTSPPWRARGLGFTNGWYRLLVDTAVVREVAPVLRVRMATAAMLLAAELETHRDRRADDPLQSQDPTEIVSLANGRVPLPAEVRDAPPEPRQFVRSYLGDLLADPGRAFVIHAHLPPDDASQARAATVLKRLRRLTNG